MPTVNEPNQMTGRVLVVDDEVGIREIISRVLTDAGFICATAANATRAWSHLQENDLDLVTLDLRMPGRSGTDLLYEINETFPDIPVVVLTGRMDVKDAVAALNYGARAYLIKPVDFAELTFRVTQEVERRHLILERRRYTERLEEKVAQQTAAIRDAHEETILRLMNASMHRDEETGAHIRRVGQCSEILARALGWTRADSQAIRMAAPMHDVGKIGIPDAILQKPGALTEAEFETMKSHTTIGASLLAGSDSPILQLAEKIARAHHERWNGTGYPDGISATSIPEAARIVSVVDVYDALTHDRVYRPALSEGKAVRLLQAGRGTQFDPDMLDVFLDLLPETREIRWQNPDDMVAMASGLGGETSHRTSSCLSF